MNRRRTVACYCATFLKPDQQHIYRQISAVNKFRAVVFAQKRENETEFPFKETVVVPKRPLGVGSGALSSGSC